MISAAEKRATAERRHFELVLTAPDRVSSHERATPARDDASFSHCLRAPYLRRLIATAHIRHIFSRHASNNATHYNVRTPLPVTRYVVAAYAPAPLACRQILLQYRAAVAHGMLEYTAARVTERGYRQELAASSSHTAHDMPSCRLLAAS